MEKWLIERGYNEKMIRNQILRAREHSRNDLLEREKQQMSEQKLTFSITYKEHKKLFPNVLVIGFRDGKSLKDFLIRATLPKN